FFAVYTSGIKKSIIPALRNSVVRPSFLAHIALELMLDSTLLTENHIQTVDFYTHLRLSDREAINRFLKLNGIDDTTYFFIFFDDRKSTRLNSSHVKISYAVFCLKKKKFNNT